MINHYLYELYFIKHDIYKNILSEHVSKHNIKRLYNKIYPIYGLKYRIDHFIEKEYDKYMNCDIIKGLCEGGHTDLVLKFIEKNGMNEHLFYYGFKGACEGGHLDLVNFFIDNYIDYYLYNGLLFKNACYGSNIDIINLFFEKMHIDYTYGIEGALKKGNLEILLYLFRKTTTNQLGWKWFLSSACQGKNLDLAKIFMKKVNSDELWTAKVIYDVGNFKFMKFFNDKLNINSYQEQLYNNYIKTCSRYNKYKKIKYSSIYIL